MNSLIKWEPLHWLEEVPSFFDSLTNTTRLKDTSFDVDVYEKDNEWVVEAALPGVNKDEISININDGLLEISVERNSEKNEENKRYTVKEMHYGKCRRLFNLPNGVDSENISARLKEGVLTLVFPKTKANKIAISD